MKVFIILFTFFSFYSFASQINFQEFFELQKRLELYGLITPKDPIPLTNKNDYNSEVLLDLQEEIFSNYIPSIQNKLGICPSGDCLKEENNYFELETANQSLCLPFTQCEFYNCMEKKYNCSDVGVDYFTQLAFPTCSTYKANIKKKWFTQKGYNWIYTVMVCLQKGLIDECEVNQNCHKDSPQKTCDYITDFTLKFHPGCYLESGVGVCNLPLKDKINIWRTVGKFLTPREREEAIKVVLECVRKDISRPTTIGIEEK